MIAIRLMISVLFFTAAFYSAFSQTETAALFEAHLKELSENLLKGNDQLHSTSDIRAFYAMNDHRPIWLDDTLNQLSIQELIDIIEDCHQEGLFPNDYHMDTIKQLHNEVYWNPRVGRITDSQILDLDILLSDALITLAIHYYTGKVHGLSMNRDWECYYDELNISVFLWDAIQKNMLRKSIEGLHPNFPQYRALRQEYIRLTGELQQYPDSLEIAKRATQITMNMERWRWLPKTQDSSYLIVNIPAFQLHYFEEDTLTMKAKVIVGTRHTPTPSFNCEISYIVLKPRWNIPNSIMKNELLPIILKDQSYLKRKNMKILSTWRHDDVSYIDPNQIRWDTISVQNFPYRLIQSPGSYNALGWVKLMLPNQFSVYLHDTNNRSLFDDSIRSFSHGCIRVQNIDSLTTYLMKDPIYNDIDKYESLFDENESRSLPKPVQIFINYWTAWPENTDIIYYEDIYNLDEKLESAMFEHIK